MYRNLTGVYRVGLPGRNQRFYGDVEIFRAEGKKWIDRSVTVFSGQCEDMGRKIHLAIWNSFLSVSFLARTWLSTSITLLYADQHSCLSREHDLSAKYNLEAASPDSGSHLQIDKLMSLPERAFKWLIMWARRVHQINAYFCAFSLIDFDWQVD